MIELISVGTTYMLYLCTRVHSTRHNLLRISNIKVVQAYNNNNNIRTYVRMNTRARIERGYDEAIVQELDRCVPAMF